MTLLINTIFIVCFVMLFFIYVDSMKYKKYSRLSFKEIASMGGYQFEEYIKILFSKLGYKSFKRKGLENFELDLLLKKENKTIAVQVKPYNEKVNLQSVRQIISGKNYYRADEAWIITNSDLLDSANIIANRYEVKLIHRNELQELMKQAFGKWD